MSIKTIYNVTSYPHAAKRKTPNVQQVSVEGTGQDAAYAVDKKFKQKGTHTRKVLVGFEINGHFVPSELNRQN